MKQIPDHVWLAAARLVRLFNAITPQERQEKATVIEEDERQVAHSAHPFGKFARVDDNSRVKKP